MPMLDFSQVELRKIITHHMGNKTREENLVLSVEPTEVNEDSKALLIKHFVQAVNTDEYYSFNQIVPEGNEIYAIARDLFANDEGFFEASKQIARRLYETALHPKIKEGELSIVLFSNLIVDNERLDAMGIFKSESIVPFLKMTQARTHFTINHDSGFDVRGADKGCLVFNSDENIGYKVLIADRTNTLDEAHYWKNDFLKLVPMRDAFQQTKQAINLTSDFLKDFLPEEFEINKADQIDLMNRSLNYFKGNNTFVQSEFEQNVLQDEAMIKSFRNFEEGFRSEKNLEPMDEFDISKAALKKQTRFLRSVLKLDKNFHIYIHGSRELIQQGMESNGRKYYKIYFEKES